MSQFSVEEVLKYAFGTYVKHWRLLTKASLLMLGIQWFFENGPGFAFDLVWYPYAFDATAMLQQSGRSIVFKEILTRLAMIPWYSYGFIVLTYLIASELYILSILGFANLCLALKDRKTATLALVIPPSVAQALRFSTAFIFVMIAAIVLMVSCLGISGVCAFYLSGTVLTKAGAKALSWIFAAILTSFVAYRWMGYLFIGFYFTDERTSSISESLRVLKAFVNGHRSFIVRVGLALLIALGVAKVFAGFTMIPVLFIIEALGNSFSFDTSSLNAIFLRFALVLFGYPFASLCITYIYRLLKPIKESV